MKHNASDKHSLSQLARIAPIVRGLLANPTGDQDTPYEPVILKSLTSKEAIDFATSFPFSQSLTAQANPSRQPSIFGCKLFPNFFSGSVGAGYASEGNALS